MRFLTLCGFVFTGIDLNAKKLTISEVQLIEVSYPNAPLLLTGLKAMSIADIELRMKRYVCDDNHDNLLWCDYRLLKEEGTDVLDILKDFINPLPEKVRKFIIELHQHNIEMGMTCKEIISTFNIHFAYSYIKNNKKTLSPRDIYQRRIWEFSFSVKHGYCIVIRAKKTDKYKDVIHNFPLSLQEIIANGYGCDRKLRNEPCKGGCQGYCLKLDDSVLSIGRAIEKWIDSEICSL